MTTSWIAESLYSPRTTCRCRNTISGNQHPRARCLPKPQLPKRSSNKDDRESPGRPISTRNSQNAKSNTKPPQIRCLEWWTHHSKQRVRQHLRKAQHNSPLANTIHCHAWTMNPKVSGEVAKPGYHALFRTNEPSKQDWQGGFPSRKTKGAHRMA